MRLVMAASWCRSSDRRSTDCVVRQAGQRTHKNQCRAVIAAPIVGENNMGMCPSCLAFQVVTRRSASAKIWGPRARRASASFAATAARSLSIRRLLKPMADNSAAGWRARQQRYILSAMCGRSTYKLTWEEIVRLYRLTLDQPARNTQARYNVCPTTTIDAIVGHDGKRELVPMRWG
jgi:hypothetical protein